MSFHRTTTDKRFGIRVADGAMEEILRRCIDSHPLETGGILVGYYNECHDCALVTMVTGPPSDSKSGRSFFYRGVRGLQRWLTNLWVNEERRYYLGEWHYHPHGLPFPSRRDSLQMEEISNDSEYHCPQPVLVVAGGDGEVISEAKAFVFPHGEDYKELANDVFEE